MSLIPKSSSYRKLLDTLALSDKIILCLLIVVVFFFLIGGDATGTAVTLHTLMLVLFAAVIAVCVNWSSHAWVPWLRTISTVAIILTLYSTLAEPAFIVMGGSRDHALAMIDRWLFAGHDPALLGETLITPFRLEFFSFIYGYFIPFLYLSIFLGCFGRPEIERREFLEGLSLTYTLAYVGYLFVPARGPIEFYHFSAPLVGGTFHKIVLSGVVATGGNHGAFPSLHVGTTAYVCLFDLRRNPLRGFTYLPMVMLIAISTILLRYHYVIDLIIGLAIAFWANRVASRERGGE